MVKFDISRDMEIITIYTVATYNSTTRGTLQKVRVRN